MDDRIALNRALVHQVAWEADNGMSRELLHAKAAMVKLTSSATAGRVVGRVETSAGLRRRPG